MIYCWCLQRAVNKSAFAILHCNINTVWFSNIYAFCSFRVETLCTIYGEITVYFITNLWDTNLHDVKEGFGIWTMLFRVKMLMMYLALYFHLGFSLDASHLSTRLRVIEYDNPRRSIHGSLKTVKNHTNAFMCAANKQISYRHKHSQCVLDWDKCDDALLYRSLPCAMQHFHAVPSLSYDDDVVYLYIKVNKYKDDCGVSIYFRHWSIIFLLGP